MQKPNIVQFLCYKPRIYSGFDNFQIKLTKQLKESSFQNILVYSDDLNLPRLKIDIINNGGIIELISTRNKLTIFRDVFKLYIKYKPKIVHTHFDNSIYLISAILAFLFRVNYYFSFWSEISQFSVIEYKNKKGLIKFLLLRTFYRFLTFVSSGALFGSNALKTQFVDYSGSESVKIQTFYLGTEIYNNKKNKNNLRKTFKLSEEILVICNISAIEQIKGIHVLIDALILLKHKFGYTDFICYHVGTFRSETAENLLLYDSLNAKIRSNCLESNFVWLEFVNDVTDILKISDIYVHPSLREGLGSANLEAATQALPIIATRTGGIPEIVHHKINGYLFSSESSDELANYLIKLIRDQDLRIKMGRESLRLVSEKFNVNKQIKLLVQLYYANLK